MEAPCFRAGEAVKGPRPPEAARDPRALDSFAGAEGPSSKRSTAGKVAGASAIVVDGLPLAPAPARAPQPGFGRYARVEHDHYVEEPWVSRRLFEERRFPGLVLDPCAGFGHIVRSARELGLAAVGSDLVKRAPGVRGDVDFLDRAYRAPRRPFPLSIVCNPPFGHFREFAERALEIADASVALLAPTHRLSAASWLLNLPLDEILCLTPRPSVLPGFVFRERMAAKEPLGGGQQDFCWLLFTVGCAFRGRLGWLKRDGGAP